MKILVADDDLISRSTLTATLGVLGHEVLEVEEGEAALAALQGEEAPRLAILDWMMPGMDGTEVCRRVRAWNLDRPPYLIVLTSRGSRNDLLEALDAGADEFLAKPFDPAELRARIDVGRRMLDLQGSLAETIHRLQSALDQVRTLEGIVPICSYCKKIRKDASYWEQLEQFISSHTGATFSHGICPDCYQHHVIPELEALKQRGRPGPT